MNTYI